MKSMQDCLAGALTLLINHKVITLKEFSDNAESADKLFELLNEKYKEQLRK